MPLSMLFFHFSPRPALVSSRAVLLFDFRGAVSCLMLFRRVWEEEAERLRALAILTALFSCA